MAVLKAGGLPCPVALLLVTAEACDSIGATAHARHLLETARNAAAGDKQLDVKERAALHIAYGRRLQADGAPDAALEAFEQARALLEAPGFARERAIALGGIARIRLQRGQVDDALRLHQESLAVFEELGDADGIANAQWSLGRLAATAGRPEEARQRLEAAYSIFLGLGRLDAICIVGLDLAPLLSAAGRVAEAKEILLRSRDGFMRLGQYGAAEEAEGLLGTVGPLDFES